MLKALFVAASLAIVPVVYAADASQESLEICVDSGECALRVWIRESSDMVYVTKSIQDFEKLRTLWTAAEFYIMAPADYDEIRGYLPEESLTLPAVNPSAHIMERKGGTPPPKPAPAPLVQGTVTVTVGGGNQCTPCHTGSLHDIHKEVMKAKKEDK